MLTSLYVIRLRPALADRRWLLVALFGWVVLQPAAVAYGRAGGPTTSRYLDVFSVGLLVNYACLLYVLDAFQSAWQRRFAYGAIVFWLAIVFTGMTIKVVKDLAPQMRKWQTAGQVQTKNLRAYLESGNIGAFENITPSDIPYPDAKHLAEIASMPAVRAILPPALVGEASALRAQQRGLARFTGRPIEALKTFALRWGVLLIPTGLALFVLGLSIGWWRDAQTSPSTARPD